MQHPTGNAGLIPPFMSNALRPQDPTNTNSPTIIDVPKMAQEFFKGSSYPGSENPNGLTRAIQAGKPTGQPGTPSVFNVPAAISALFGGSKTHPQPVAQPQPNSYQGPMAFPQPARQSPISSAVDDILMKYDNIPQHLQQYEGSGVDDGQALSVALSQAQAPDTSAAGTSAYMGPQSPMGARAMSEIAQELEQEKRRQRQPGMIPTSSQMLQQMLNQLYQPYPTNGIRPSY